MGSRGSAWSWHSGLRRSLVGCAAHQFTFPLIIVAASFGNLVEFHAFIPSCPLTSKASILSTAVDRHPSTCSGLFLASCFLSFSSLLKDLLGLCIDCLISRCDRVHPRWRSTPSNPSPFLLSTDHSALSCGPYSRRAMRPSLAIRPPTSSLWLARRPCQR